MTILPKINSVLCAAKSDLSQAPSSVLVAVVGEGFFAQKDPAFQALDKALNGFISQSIDPECFSGKWGQSVGTYLPQGLGFKSLLLLGASPENSSQPLARCRQLALNASDFFKKGKWKSATLYTCAHLFQNVGELEQWVVGLHLGLYTYPKGTPTEPEDNTPFSCSVVTALAGVGEALQRGSILGEATSRCRLLQDGPPNKVNPESFAQVFQERAKDQGLSASIWGRAILGEKGFHGLLAVSSGSAYEPQFIQMTYTPASYQKTLVLVGKGLTMDSGGYSLKPPLSQIGMKYDMSGAAVVMTAIEAIAQLKLPIKVVSLAVMCENMVDALAYRVNDVIQGYAGKSIEILNTDAEGRIVLSDALAYGDKDIKPDLMVNFATLTGAMLVSLGHFGAGCFAFDNPLAEKVIESASQKTGERVHFFPVYEEINDEFKSQVADVSNIATADTGKAGSMLAAAFLKHFTGETPFAHLDIAGVSDGNKAIGYPRKGGSGYGVQLAVAIAQSLAST